ncbi:MFS transporter [Rubrobacter tropicus]|uniref:MFS transporter n=1 Tax=Rubrobacter tropicus TaxID=2653851 RepID=A0A6G8QAY6_9ACTN|nr:MFS transporter [Rubrobacter tropicus]QIN83593.1 MFS transporter [Rubrobacter tropicus]
MALLGAAVGALLSMTVVGALISRLGSRRMVGATALLLPFSLIPLALAPNVAALTAALVFVGACNGALDVSMNAHAVAVETRYERRIMSSFHAAFSFGALAGSVLGGGVAYLGIGVLPHFLTVFVIATLAAVPAYLALLPSDADAADGGAPAFARPTRALLGLGIISFCVLLGEGAMSDWSAVYLDDTLSTGPGFAAAGYAAFSLAMALGRLFGDGLAERFGPTNLVRLCGAVAAAGLGTALAVGNPVFALVGFACAGAGFSVVFPLALSAAGQTEDVATGPALAAVSTAAYTGFLVGPPTIGFLAELTGLGTALYLVVGLSTAIFVLGGTVRPKSGKKT